jgi:hypothetical protein
MAVAAASGSGTCHFAARRRAMNSCVVGALTARLPTRCRRQKTTDSRDKTEDRRRKKGYQVIRKSGCFSAPERGDFSKNYVILQLSLTAIISSGLYYIERLIFSKMGCCAGAAILLSLLQKRFNHRGAVFSGFPAGQPQHRGQDLRRVGQFHNRPAGRPGPCRCSLDRSRHRQPSR